MAQCVVYMHCIWNKEVIYTTVYYNHACHDVYISNTPKSDIIVLAIRYSTENNIIVLKDLKLERIKYGFEINPVVLYFLLII